MYQLNESNIPEIGKWSMRNIRKLFRRITKQQINDSSYFNVTVEHQIVFYILGNIQGGVEEKLIVYEKIEELLRKTFYLKNELYEKIKNCIESKPRIIEINKKKFLVKGDSEESLKNKEKTEKIKSYTNAVGEAGILLDKPLEDKIELSSLYETLFYVLFSHYKEPLLLCGPSGYKSKLAKDISPNACIINFYPEISNAQLIGSTSLVANYQAKEYYLEQICKICKKEEKLKDLKEDLKDYYKEKKKEAIQKKEKKNKIKKILIEKDKKTDGKSDTNKKEAENTKKEEKKEDSEEDKKEKKKKKKDDSDEDESEEDKKKKKKKKR